MTSILDAAVENCPACGSTKTVTGGRCTFNNCLFVMCSHPVGSQCGVDTRSYLADNFQDENEGQPLPHHLKIVPSDGTLQYTQSDRAGRYSVIQEKKRTRKEYGEIAADVWGIDFANFVTHLNPYATGSDSNTVAPTSTAGSDTESDTDSITENENENSNDADLFDNVTTAPNYHDPTNGLGFFISSDSSSDTDSDSGVYQPYIRTVLRHDSCIPDIALCHGRYGDMHAEGLNLLHRGFEDVTSTAWPAEAADNRGPTTPMIAGKSVRKAIMVGGKSARKVLGLWVNGDVERDWIVLWNGEEFGVWLAPVWGDEDEDGDADMDEGSVEGSENEDDDCEEDISSGFGAMQLADGEDNDVEMEL